MSGKRHPRLESLFEEALQLSGEALEAFIARQCAGDDELRAMLEGLLAAHVSETSRLRGTAVRLPLDHLDQEPAADRDRSTERSLGGDRGRLTPGERVGPYTIIQEIGEGGMATVFLARDHKLGRNVAIKVMFSRDPSSNQRFRVEARATARCKHENIVVIHDIGEHAEYPYLVLEYISGQTLRAMLWAEARMAPGRARTLMIPVVRALVCAHGLGIVHRDLKPENVMVTDAGGVKVMDFGIAKNLARDLSTTVMDGPERRRASHTQTGLMVGTLRYMSPEQWGAADVDHRSDIWAAGIMLYEMVAGRHPVAPPSPERLYEVVANATVRMPSARDIEPSIGPLADIIDRCLAKHPAERFASAGELLATLESAAESAGPAAVGKFSAHMDAPTSAAFRNSARAGENGRNAATEGAADVLEFARVTSDPADEHWQHLHARPPGSPFERPCKIWLSLGEGAEDAALPLDITIINLAPRPLLLTAIGLEILVVHWNFAGQGRGMDDFALPAFRTPMAARLARSDQYVFDAYSLLQSLAPYRKQALAGLRASLQKARGGDDPAELERVLAEYGAQTVEIRESCWHRLADPIYQETSAPYRYGLRVDEFQALLPRHMVVRLCVESQLGIGYSESVEVLMPAPPVKR